jgi:hypothetical protein
MTARHLSLLLAPVFVLSACRTQDATRIGIQSVWVGLAEMQQDTLEIVCLGEKCSARGQSVPVQDVTSLLQVVAAPPMPQAELPNLGITQQWLNERAASALLGEGGCAFTQEHKALLASKFTNVQAVKAFLPGLLQPGTSDDDPWVSIEILKNGETVWQLESSSQSKLFMLPWVIKAPRGSFTTYNADVSRALARLLPEKFVNRDRITGAGLEHELGYRVARHFLDSCEAVACHPCSK